MTLLISVPAGRCFRRADSKWVDAQPDKGCVELTIQDDLMHLHWKNRTTGTIEDDLIVFPGEAIFEKVSQDSTGRTHILKFTSSDQKYFFWFQRKDTSGYARAQVDIHGFLQNPEYQIGSAPLPNAPPTTDTEPPTAVVDAVTSTSATASGEASTSAAANAEGGAAGGANANTHTEMARLLMQWAQAGGIEAGAGAGGPHEDASLTVVMSPARITALVNANPEIVDSIAPHLPPALGLGDKPEAKDVLPILLAPQLADSINSLEEALRSGGLPGSVMRELGLPEDAGQSVSAFLEALRGLKKDGEGAKDDSAMETD